MVQFGFIIIRGRLSLTKLSYIRSPGSRFSEPTKGTYPLLRVSCPRSRDLPSVLPYNND